MVEERTNYKEGKGYDERSKFLEVRAQGGAAVAAAFLLAGLILPVLLWASSDTQSNQITIDVRLFSALMGVLFGAAAAATYGILYTQRQQHRERMLLLSESAQLMNEWRLFEDLTFSAAHVTPKGNRVGDIRSAINSLFEQRILTPEDVGWVQIALETRNNIAHRARLETDRAKINLVGRQLSRVNHELRRRINEKPSRTQAVKASPLPEH